MLGLLLGVPPSYMHMYLCIFPLHSSDCCMTPTQWRLVLRGLGWHGPHRTGRVARGLLGRLATSDHPPPPPSPYSPLFGVVCHDDAPSGRVSRGVPQAVGVPLHRHAVRRDGQPGCAPARGIRTVSFFFFFLFSFFSADVVFHFWQSMARDMLG